MKKYCFFILSLLVASSSYGWDRRLQIYPGDSIRQSRGVLEGEALEKAKKDACTNAKAVCQSREWEYWGQTKVQVFCEEPEVTVSQPQLIVGEFCNTGEPYNYDPNVGNSCYLTRVYCKLKSRVVHN